MIVVVVPDAPVLETDDLAGCFFLLLLILRRQRVIKVGLFF